MKRERAARAPVRPDAGTAREWAPGRFLEEFPIYRVVDEEGRLVAGAELELGEAEPELLETMRDLRAHGVEILTLGQYLRPSAWHLPVAEFVSPERFEALRRRGLGLGFRYVASGPLVRSSYRAAELFLRGELAAAPPPAGRRPDEA